MEWLWQLDQNLFRAMHEGLGIPYGPIVQVFNDMGLGHVQLTALLIIGLRPKLTNGAVIGAVVGVGTALYFIEERGQTTVAFFLVLSLLWPLRPKWAFGAFYAAALAGLTRLAFVGPIARERPSNFEYTQPLEQLFARTSFPSGHSTTTFAIAILLAWILISNGKKGYAWLILAWSLVTALGRVAAGVHYPTDIVGALCLGAAMSSILWILLDRADWFSQSAKTRASGTDRSGAA